MRILFIGTGDIGLPSLEWLIYTPKHQVVGVVTQPDKPAGRKLVLTPPQTKVRAQAAGIPVLQPLKIRHAVEELKAFNADVAVVVAYGQILSRDVLNVPKLACLNIHASLLPKYRGASPIQAAIRAGDAETGVTIMHMDEGLDTGDILLMDRVTIEPTDTGGTLHDKLALAAPSSLEEALDLIASGPAPRKAQDNALATHCGKLKREDGRLDWTRPAVELEFLIRAYNPWPGTFTLLPGDKPAPLKVHRARVIPEAESCPAPGTVVSSDPKTGLIVACGQGLLALEEVQAEGGKKMAAGDFLRGKGLETGLLLG
ncbi:methionyl-tRNA formyltransferase [Prosthecobacter fusiformis]|uniref:Methionyl-tRNA formyltransferase n=1 Tax=Prosthecobacter fusiformis TaxID=48464 RepID=A0A4R7SQA9_9BACT|nr:methionyl-tRNA formyltransferase [Prosthecobacter fusiformis]TDU81410.1 methionyl-tRNA formyltransferase [Prosthecobacter fusiformis]